MCVYVWVCVCVSVNLNPYFEEVFADHVLVCSFMSECAIFYHKHIIFGGFYHVCVRAYVCVCVYIYIYIYI